MAQYKTAQELIEGINWKDLKAQKQALLEVMNLTTDEKKVENLQGILTMIDNVQDFAVDVMGKDENEVFNLTEEV